jgi:toxin-antitoxin system PIN domain toxin
LSKPRFLLDVNVLVALADEEHVHHRAAKRWLTAERRDWGTCCLSEAGFFRVTARLSADVATMEDIAATYDGMTRYPGYRYWPISDPLPVLVRPFAARIFGPNQITDAVLLGLAIKGKGVLVTFDHGVRFLAGPEHAANVLVLE